MIIILNNKSNLEKEEFTNYISKLNQLNTNLNLVLCPSTIYLNNLNLNSIKIGSQDVSCYDDGAHTGEVSARQLKDLGVSYSIVGHSERRKDNHETNQDINRKIVKLLDNDIIPILCVGETIDERKNNLTNKKIEQEITEALESIEDKRIIVAYEPIWAIGTGKTPTPEEINEVIIHIRKLLPNNKVIYGGSINEKNVKDINNNTNLDGYLLGGISLNIERLNLLLKELQ